MLSLHQVLPALQDPDIHQDSLMAPQPQSDDNRNTKRLKSNDENARSVVLLQFLCEQCHAGVSAWTKKTRARAGFPAADMPIRIHCKTGSLSARLVFETGANCQDFVAQFMEDGLPDTVDSPLFNSSATFLVR